MKLMDYLTRYRLLLHLAQLQTQKKLKNMKMYLKSQKNHKIKLDEQINIDPSIVIKRYLMFLCHTTDICTKGLKFDIFTNSK